VDGTGGGVADFGEGAGAGADGMMTMGGLGSPPPAPVAATAGDTATDTAGDTGAGGDAGTDTFGVDTLAAATALVGGRGGDVTLGLLAVDTLGLAAIPSFSMALAMFDDDTPSLDSSSAVLDEPLAPLVGVDSGARAGDLWATGEG
jgi:hypothetical protein